MQAAFDRETPGLTLARAPATMRALAMTIRRRPSIGRGIPALGALLTWMALACACTPASAAPLPPAQERALARADSLTGVERPAAAAALLDSLAAFARAGGDARLERACAIGRARMALVASRLGEADSLLARIAPAIRAARDTLLRVRALRVQARLEELRNQPDTAARDYQLAITLARRAGLALEEARGEMAAARSAGVNGRNDEACAALRRAIAVLQRADDPATLIRAHIGLANALFAMSKGDEARAEYLLALDLAHRGGDLAGELDASYNLGVVEHTFGDISKAEGYYRRANALARALGWADREVRIAIGLTILKLNGGKVAEADSILSVALPVALSGRVGVEVRALATGQLGVVRRQQGRTQEAIETGRRAVAASDSISATAAFTVTNTLVGTLDHAGRTDEAIALIAEQLRRLGPRLSPVQRASLVAVQATFAMKQGRPREAIPPLRAAVGTGIEVKGSFGYDDLRLMSQLAICYGLIGERDSSLLWHRRVADAWESWRHDTRDRSWLEVYDGHGQRFAAAYAVALLDPGRGGSGSARASEAFVMLQRFRARTLTERVYEPGSAPANAARAFDLAAFRRTTLRSGELFLDVHVTPETTLVIAIARDTVRAWGAPRAAVMQPRMKRLHDLLADRSSAGGELWSGAASAIGADLFGPGADLISGSTRLLISAGSFAEMPLGVLTLPGSKEPVMAGRELGLIPSAALLAASRARPSAGSSGAPLVAFARTRDDAGRELPGAGDEARWLARSFAHAQAHVDDNRVTPASVLSLAGKYDVLHFAAHSREVTERPWQSGLLLGRPGTEDAWLQAGDITRSRTTARLCVLAGCSSVGHSELLGETLNGLATAWLVAGVRTVIATQWAVDDRATSALMRRFYEGLGRGQSAGEALRAAQLEMRGASGASSPGDWAGFVTLGDPEIRVRLDRR